MGCAATSPCKTLTVFTECTPQIPQGTDATFELQLFDESGTPLNLDTVI